MQKIPLMVYHRFGITLSIAIRACAIVGLFSTFIAIGMATFGPEKLSEAQLRIFDVCIYLASVSGAVFIAMLARIIGVSFLMEKR